MPTHSPWVHLCSTQTTPHAQQSSRSRCAIDGTLPNPNIANFPHSNISTKEANEWPHDRGKGRPSERSPQLDRVVKQNPWIIKHFCPVNSRDIHPPKPSGAPAPMYRGLCLHGAHACLLGSSNHVWITGDNQCGTDVVEMVITPYCLWANGWTCSVQVRCSLQYLSKCSWLKPGVQGPWVQRRTVLTLTK